MAPTVNLPALCLLVVSCLTVSHPYSLERCLQYYHDLTQVYCVNHRIRNLSLTLKDIPPSTLVLNLSRNEIGDLGEGRFSHLPSLQVLRIDQNQLRRVGSASFNGLRKLSLLNLSCNNIDTLLSRSFWGLGNLRTLLLSQNNLSVLHQGALPPLAELVQLDLHLNSLRDWANLVAAVRELPRLEALDLSGNSIAQLSLQNVSFPALRDLNLSYNPIADLDPGAFLRMPNLSSLSLNGLQLNLSELGLRSLRTLQVSNGSAFAGPQLADSCRFLERLRGLQELVAKSAGLTSEGLQVLSRCVQPTSLDLSWNALGPLDGGEFERFEALVRLRLVNCSIAKLSNATWMRSNRLKHLQINLSKGLQLEAFAFSNLEALEYLDVSANRLRQVDVSVFYGLEDLQQLHFEGNEVTDLDQAPFRHLRNLRGLSLGWNNIRAIRRSAFQNLGRLEKLFLAQNRIGHVEGGSFSGLVSLKVLHLWGNSLKELPLGAFAGLRSLLHLDISKNKLSTWSSSRRAPRSPFATLNQLRFLGLQDQGFHGLGLLPNTYFKGLHNLEKLVLGYGGRIQFADATFQLLPNLRELHISYAKLEALDFPHLFRPLKRLEVLFLTSVELDDIPVSLFQGLPHLRFITLDRNHLKNLSQKLLDNLDSLQCLSLDNNPLSCSCTNAWFHNWSIEDPRVQIPFLSSYRCSHKRGSFVNFDTSPCNIDFSQYCFLATSVMTLFVMALPALYTKANIYCRYLWYMQRAWLGGRRGDKLGKGCKYDAFVSYSSSDEEWVVNQLLPHLEQQGPERFHICLHSRDFELGLDIFRNIEKAIYSSRKTLCVISSQYLRSEWCSLEIQLASLRLFHDQNDVLILIFLEDIPNYQLSAYHKLRKLLKSKTYIEWPEKMEKQELFWARLREALRNTDSLDKGDQIGDVVVS
ncbi:toll-like receptor 13 [Carcharodon carcharias]|uniref:toll-like receptor 13 n=1 Tax=Carcharodon carcharias TaxID=13397 RepID=UPI001B7DC748|nr:toll-like receptor 13 [Carcharodon carcharias]